MIDCKIFTRTVLFDHFDIGVIIQNSPAEANQQVNWNYPSVGFFLLIKHMSYFIYLNDIIGFVLQLQHMSMFNSLIAIVVFSL